LQLADQENEQRRRLEQAALEALNKPNEEVIKRNKLNQKKQQVSDGGLQNHSAIHRDRPILDVTAKFPSLKLVQVK